MIGSSWLAVLVMSVMTAGGEPDAGRASAPVDAPPAADPGRVLAGPDVPASAEADAAESDRTMRRMAGRAGGNTLWPQWYGAVLHIDLEEDQRSQIESIARELRSAQRAFLREHSQAIAESRRAAREARDAGQRLPEDVRAKMLRLRATAPKVEEAQQQIWDLLNSEQQEALRMKLAAFEAHGMKAAAARQLQARVADATEREKAVSQAMPRWRGSSDESELDAPARQRLEFLRSRQLQQSPRVKPSAPDRRFTFEDEESGPGITGPDLAPRDDTEQD